MGSGAELLSPDCSTALSAQRRPKRRRLVHSRATRHPVFTRIAGLFGESWAGSHGSGGGAGEDRREQRASGVRHRDLPPRARPARGLDHQAVSRRAPTGHAPPSKDRTRHRRPRDCVPLPDLHQLVHWKSHGDSSSWTHRFSGTTPPGRRSRAHPAWGRDRSRQPRTRRRSATEAPAPGPTETASRRG